MQAVSIRALEFDPSECDASCAAGRSRLARARAALRIFAPDELQPSELTPFHTDIRRDTVGHMHVSPRSPTTEKITWAARNRPARVRPNTRTRAPVALKCADRITGGRHDRGMNPIACHCPRQAHADAKPTLDRSLALLSDGGHVMHGPGCLPTPQCRPSCTRQGRKVPRTRLDCELDRSGAESRRLSERLPKSANNTNVDQ